MGRKEDALPPLIMRCNCSRPHNACGDAPSMSRIIVVKTIRHATTSTDKNLKPDNRTQNLL